ncbi:hypothetical protein [Bradyrhizobium sp. NP1]|nr:hypothetical protein [Bradyrhizobium sp. NP1]WJR80077.1 hypothetical protein QOU61_10050 [Bradyrhizobium sp. NP1]
MQSIKDERAAHHRATHPDATRVGAAGCCRVRGQLKAKLGRSSV